MLTNDYAQALFDLYESGMDPDTLVHNLHAVLKERGHEALLHEVLQRVLVLLERHGDSRSHLIVRNEHDAAALKEEIDRAVAALGAPQGAMVTSTDPNIVGGFRITYGHKHVDATYRTALLRLYRHITT